ncbi:MAG: hypothetical protein PHY43_13090 [Verrucomicrobiales bacterium]|nr:hypothetical protein [Verrucomicrobiales bacterium]
MPIRINLLAEAKIAEELRRRDPVKRAMFVGAFLVVFALVWSSSLQLEVLISKKDLSRVQAEIMTRTNEYQTVLVSQRKVTAIKGKLESLQQLSNARFLHGNYLNALQLATMDGVQLMRIRLSQSFVNTPGVANQTNNNHVILGHPATVTQNIVLALDAKDFSANPGDAVDKFKEKIASQAYFKTMLNQTNGVKLISLSSPQSGPDVRPYVMFNLECYYPEKTQ